MADYGVIPTGFNRKPLPQILGEVEAAVVTEFGPNVIQTPESPFGQINGLFADLVAQLWEFAEDVYQSYDPAQAEGLRLDTLAELRLLRRSNGELDDSFRGAITNQGRARIDIQDITREVREVEGVEFIHVWVNDTTLVDPTNGLPPGALSVVVIGGADDEVAAVLRRFVVPGTATHGNTYVSTSEDGYCRTMVILRPYLVPVELKVYVTLRKDAMGCPAPSVQAIRDALVAALSFGGSHELKNDDDVTFYRVRSVIESLFPNVEVRYIEGSRDGNGLSSGGVIINFSEIATLSIDDVEVDPT